MNRDDPLLSRLRVLRVRDESVLIDSDLAALYEVETKVFNQAIRRNAHWFPPDFAFQLSLTDAGETTDHTDGHGYSGGRTSNQKQISSSTVQCISLSSEFASNALIRVDRCNPWLISSDLIREEEWTALRSQFVTSKLAGRGQHRKYLPCVITEHGTIMAATILNSERAVAMSTYVVRAFLRLRRELLTNAAMELRLTKIEKELLSHDAALRTLFSEIVLRAPENRDAPLSRRPGSGDPKVPRTVRANGRPRRKIPRREASRWPLRFPERCSCPARWFNRAALSSGEKPWVFSKPREEKSDVVAKCDHLRNRRFAKGLPYVFTEHGAIQAANVLNSDAAIERGVHVVRAFVRLRQWPGTQKAFAAKLNDGVRQHGDGVVQRSETTRRVQLRATLAGCSNGRRASQLESRVGQHDEQLAAVIEALRQVTASPELRYDRKMGFHRGNR